MGFRSILEIYEVHCQSILVHIQSYTKSLEVFLKFLYVVPCLFTYAHEHQ